MPVDHGSLMPAWSPDGRWIAFESDRDGDFEIYLMDATGGRLRQLTHNRTEDHLPSWLPDGKAIRFLAGPMEKFMDPDGWLELPIDGGSPRPAHWGPGLADTARSRDGRVLAYTEPDSGVAGHGGPQVLLVRLSGAVPRRISPPGHAEEPVISPDGRTLVFEHRKPGDELNDSMLFITDLAPAARARPLTPGTTPSWSPDGRLILFKSWDSRAQTLVVSTIRPDGTALRHLSPGVMPSWSPDGRLILFMSGKENRWEVATMAPDGTSRRCLTCAGSGGRQQ
jgi:TolB protein